MASIQANFARSISISDEHDDFPLLTFQLQTLEDPTGLLTFEQILYNEDFRPQTPSTPINQHLESAYWIKFDIKGDPESYKKWVYEIYNLHINHVEMYKPISDEEYIISTTGYSLPFKEREYQHINFVFDIDLKYKGTRTFYLRLQSKNPVWLDSHIKNQNYFNKYAVNEYFLLGLYYGILMIMVLYNLLIFVSTRERVYIYFVLYILSCGFLSMVDDGMGFAYVWSELPSFSDYAAHFTRLLLLLSFVLYSRKFLQISILQPKIDKLLTWSVMLYMLIFTSEHSLSLSVLQQGYFPYIIKGLYLIPFLLIFLGGMLSWKRNYQPARYFVFGFTLVLVSLFITVMRDNGFTVGSFLLNILIVYSLNIGIVLQIAFLSKALADRIRFLKDEKQKAQEATIIQLQENEKLKDKVNRELEAKVKERTIELHEKNRNIMDSIAYAKRIQNSILPSKDQLISLLHEYFVFFKPKDLVSGDFYWVEQVGNKVLFAVIDCTGHGVPGALMTVMAHNLLHETVNEQGIHLPHEILNILDKKLRQRITQNPNEFNEQYGMDVSMCLLDRDTQQLHYAGALHNALIVSSDQKSKILKGDRFPVGDSHLNPENKTFTSHTTTVERGQKLYLFTDGFADQFGGELGHKFMVENFHKLLIDSSTKSFGDQFKEIKMTFEVWKGVYSQIDDVLLLGIKV